MKEKIILTAAIALMLTSCGEEIGAVKVKKVTGEQSSSIAETTVTTTTTAATTTAATTAKPKKAEPTIEHINEVEVFSKMKLSDFVINTNGELAEPDALIDTSEVGEKKFKIKVTLDGKETETELSYTVVDKTAPVLLGGDYISVSQGDAGDLSGYLCYADNYDKYPTLTIDGYVDTSVTGTQNVPVTLSDSSGNTVTKDITVEVVGSVPSFIQPTNDRLSFADYMARYQGGNAEVGIDVSAYQGNIDFNAVASEGCSFAMIRAATCSGSAVNVDDYFIQNLDNAQAAGIDCGLYVYSSDNDPEAVRSHAQWLVSALAGRSLSMPIAFDWEDFGHFRNYGMSLHDLNELYRVFKEELNAAGYKTMLYGSRNFLISAWDTEGEDIWLAHYVDQTDYAGQYSIWQTGVGRISGIDGDVDLDIRYR